MTLLSAVVQFKVTNLQVMGQGDEVVYDFGKRSSIGKPCRFVAKLNVNMANDSERAIPLHSLNEHFIS